MSKVLPTIQEIQKELNALSEQKTLAQAQRVILAVIRLLDGSVSLDDQNLFQLFADSDGKIRANGSWFFEDQVIVDRKATYKIHSDNKLNIDFKLYGVTKPSKRTIAWAQALTPNFEDEPFNTKFNVGIDFIVPKSVDKIIIVLSNQYVVRTLELKGALTVTFQEILAKWAEITDFSNKKEVHSVLWESFDLQPLNKKFYAGISERFITLRQHLAKENILDDKHSSLFANRLIGRVIFCWFLDKKGVINPDRKYFDANAFDDDTEYYRKSLENLFFGVLNTPIDDRDYKDDVTPFLNGGLFEARESDLYKDSKLTFPKNYFDDLFEFLSGYNFTTDESTSQFQQVAIDPEMLGRIFENLLAEMTEETGEQARKAKGAFYTPREVVDYMCRESLREYLKTKIPEDEFRDKRFVQLIDAPDKDFQDQDHNWRRDWKPYKDGIIKALDDLKVLDPACGSGAFPIGMLQLLVRVYERLEPRFDNYKAKLQVIENNIYGVDIEPMAVEIARLRAWLSIVVDEGADSKNIKPLPNLEFKFICANSLINLEQNGHALGDDPELADKLQQIRDAYFDTGSIAKKKKLRNDYEKLVNQGESLFGESLRSKQLKSYRPFDSESSAAFFDPLFMFGVDCFNVIIGNPPYVSSWNINPAVKKYFEEKYKTAVGHYDIFILFYERFLLLLCDKGVLSYITSNKWMAQGYGLGLRSLLLSDEFKIRKLIDFRSHRVFESATVDTGITIVQKERAGGEDYDFFVYSHHSDEIPNFNQIQFTNFRAGQLRKNKDLNFKIDVDDESSKLIQKIEKLSIDFVDVLYVSKGAELHSTTEKIGKDVYIYEEQKPGFKKYIEGKYFEKYKVKKKMYLNYTPSKHKAPVFPELFEAKKIIVKNVVGRGGIQAILDTEGMYNNDALINAVPYWQLEGLKYRQLKNQVTPERVARSRDYPLELIIAIVNSKLATWYFTNVMANGLHFYPNHLKKLRVPEISGKKSTVSEIVKLVSKLTTSHLGGTEYSKIESEIDFKVFELFELTNEEQTLIQKQVV